ncbi:Putative tetratricopeptide-like helical domain superfamily [Colletotrichum destructivum]|uniref:Tetratricopeptide-like helical domain superfamily n=1 Tax=Colletotrichum destructivum TaxID=34406 RepID=A0AAX4IR09_9PEZI|nr:Putative tetratricopeptide-like helical domain superfamily [Colletotrichum destructivum]
MSVYTSSNQPSLAKHSIKEEEPSAVHVDDVANSDTSRSSSISLDALTMVASHEAHTSYKIVRVIDTARRIQKKLVREVEEVSHQHFQSIDLEAYLAYIADERLVHMPPKGSQWDRVLKSAEFFGLQLDGYSRHIQSFIEGCTLVRDTALATCYLLLELGHDQAQALEPTFNALYELGLLLGQAIRLHGMFTASDAIRYELSRIFDSVIRLVGDIAVYYRTRINSIYSGSVTIDFDAEFGSQITKIWAQREHLFNHMWQHRLGNKSRRLDITTLRRHLLPTRESAKSHVYGRVADRKLRVDGTCDWLSHDLHDFLSSENDIFTVTGGEGCGKSMLAAWVRERLERPVHRTQYETLSYTFSTDIPSEATPIAFLKSLLSQLLEVNVGDVALFEKLEGIFEHVSPHNNSSKLESDLWGALDSSLASINNKKVNLVLVVDGLDEISGGASKAEELHKRLHTSIGKLPRIQAVTLSRPISHLGGSRCKHLVITPDHVRDDIELYLATRLSQSCCFTAQNEDARRALVGQIADQARGSFLFAYLARRLFTSVSDFAAFRGMLSNCKSDVKAVIGELMKRVNLKEEYGESKTYNLFTFMVTAERPLTVGEMTDLLGVSLSTRTVSSGADVMGPVRNTQGLVIVRRGTLRFKHSTVRKYVQGLCGSTLMSMHDSHRHLTMALLLFAKKRFTYSCEPSLELIADEVFQECFQANHIVSYMMRHWVSHFRSSSLCGQNGSITLTAEFKEVFPDTVFFSMLEWHHWQTQYGIKETIEMHNLSLRIRCTSFGEKNRCYLQSLIILASLHRRQSEFEIAAEFFYKASHIGQTILYKFSPLVVSCTNLFLTCTETLTFTKRTTTVTHREEMIKFMIEISRNKQGARSDAVIKWHEALAKLYVDIKESEAAMAIYKELQIIVTARFGKGSKSEGKIAEALSGMTVVLKANGDKGGAGHEHWRHLLFETAEELSFTDVRRIKILISLARDYEAKGHIIQAERLYVSLWRGILEACRTKATTELHIQKISIAIEYIHFLKRIKRNEEACNIMICVWAEYENQNFESETIMIRLKELGVLAKSFGILTVSMNILKKVWGWFKERKTIESEEAVSTTTIITEVVEEITETVVETKTSITVVETVTREIWEANYQRCRKGKTDRHFFKACLNMVNLYLKLENWAEAEVVIRKTLEVTWKGVLTVDSKLTLEGEFISERISVARRLALCYHRQRQFERADEIYLRIYHACFSAFKAENVLVLESAEALVQFYEDFHRHDKVIEIYSTLLQHYRKYLSAGHSMTVQVLYKLAAVYHKLGRKEAYDCYAEIVTIFSRDGCCHGSALDAAVIVLNHYHAEKRWAELQKICATLWSTFVHRSGEIKFSQETVELIYARYRYVLEVHAKAEFSVRYKLTIEYRETATKVFGASAAIVIKALIAQAEMCEASEEHRHESITIYEEIIRKTTTANIVSETTVRTIKKRLSKLYVTVITSNKSTTTTTIERAIGVSLEIYGQLKVELGWWHETTLTKLREIVLMYKKVGSKEAHASITQLLQASIIEIITTVRVSMHLHSAAKTLASIYVSAGMAHHGQDLLRQLRYLLLFPGFEGGEKDISIKISGQSSKVYLVFLISFEQALGGESKTTTYSFSELMADVLLETVLYEQYMSVMSTVTDSTRIETIIEPAARLRFVWESRNRKGFVSVLDKKLFALFTSRYGKFLGGQDANVTFGFYEALLAEIGGGIAADRGAIDFALVSCKAAFASVRRLMVEENNFAKANGVARCAFEFAHAQRFYHQRNCHAWGFRLAEVLAGIDVDNWKTADAKQKENMLATSRHVLQHVLAALKEEKVEFTSLRFEDISSLVYLLGEQKNWTDLETVLTSLWRSREVQRNCGVWTPDVVLTIGSLLVNAHELAGHLDQAIGLCETIYYNVRQSRGGLDHSALYFSNRLTYLLRHANRLRDAGRVHLDVARDLDEHLAATRGSDRDERLRAAADVHLDGMRRCGWATRGGDGGRGAGEILERLRGYGKLSVPPIEEWTAADEKKEAGRVWPEAIRWDLGKPEAAEVAAAAPKKKRDLLSPAKERWGRLGFRQIGWEAVY